MKKYVGGSIKDKTITNVKPVSQQDKEQIEKAFANAGMQIEVTGVLEKEEKYPKIFNMPPEAIKRMTLI
ncbi:hypothetical protein [Brevibacillus sp. NRS-1366]|uniref:hypothetical protein n=1 Tax=Brevibacillus sp. NRS-1366 TaxID=3233899 RepID=UPI003D1DC5A3